MFSHQEPVRFWICLGLNQGSQILVNSSAFLRWQFLDSTMAYRFLIDTSRTHHIARSTSPLIRLFSRYLHPTRSANRIILPVIGSPTTLVSPQGPQSPLRSPRPGACNRVSNALPQSCWQESSAPIRSRTLSDPRQKILVRKQEKATSPVIRQRL